MPRGCGRRWAARNGHLRIAGVVPHRRPRRQQRRVPGGAGRARRGVLVLARGPPRRAGRGHRRKRAAPPRRSADGMVVRRRDRRDERGRDSTIRVARTVAVVVSGRLTALVLSAGDLPVPGGLAAEVIGIAAPSGSSASPRRAAGSADSQTCFCRHGTRAVSPRGQTAALIGQTMRTRNALQGGTMSATASLPHTPRRRGHIVGPSRRRSRHRCCCNDFGSANSDSSSATLKVHPTNQQIVSTITPTGTSSVSTKAAAPGGAPVAAADRVDDHPPAAQPQPRERPAGRGVFPTARRDLRSPVTTPPLSASQSPAHRRPGSGASMRQDWAGGVGSARLVGRSGAARGLGGRSTPALHPRRGRVPRGRSR